MALRGKEETFVRRFAAGGNDGVPFNPRGYGDHSRRFAARGNEIVDHENFRESCDGDHPRRFAARGNEDPDLIYDSSPVFDEYEDDVWYAWATGGSYRCGFDEVVRWNENSLSPKIVAVENGGVAVTPVGEVMANDGVNKIDGGGHAISLADPQISMVSFDDLNIYYECGSMETMGMKGKSLIIEYVKTSSISFNKFIKGDTMANGGDMMVSGGNEYLVGIFEKSSNDSKNYGELVFFKSQDKDNISIANLVDEISAKYDNILYGVTYKELLSKAKNGNDINFAPNITVTLERGDTLANGISMQTLHEAFTCGAPKSTRLLNELMGQDNKVHGKSHEALNLVMGPQVNNDKVYMGLFVNVFANNNLLVDCGLQDQMVRNDYEGPITTTLVEINSLTSKIATINCLVGVELFERVKSIANNKPPDVPFDPGGTSAESGETIRKVELFRWVVMIIDRNRIGVPFDPGGFGLKTKLEDEFFLKTGRMMRIDPTSLFIS